MLSNLSNILTLSRIIVIPIVVGFIAWGTPYSSAFACIVFILAGITDYLDGKIARARQQLSDFGRMFDPIADKLLVDVRLKMHGLMIILEYMQGHFLNLLQSQFPFFELGHCSFE